MKRWPELALPHDRSKGARKMNTWEGLVMPHVEARIWHHGKSHGTYEVIALARSVESLKPLVVYASMHDRDAIWVRDADEFLDGRFAPVATAADLEMLPLPARHDRPALLPLPFVSHRRYKLRAGPLAPTVEIVTVARQEWDLVPVIVYRTAPELGSGKVAECWSMPAADFFARVG